MFQTSGLTIRQHERAGIAVPIEFVVNEDHGKQVRFSSVSGAVTHHAIRGQAVDISSGGMGLECQHFVPRMCEGIVRVFGMDENSPGTVNYDIPNILFEHPVKVRRVYLITREPLYALGVAFVDPDPTVDQQIANLMSLIHKTHGKMNSPGSNGGGRDA